MTGRWERKRRPRSRQIGWFSATAARVHARNLNCVWRRDALYECFSGRKTLSLSLSFSFSRFRVKMFFPSSVKSWIAVRITGTIQIRCFLPRKMLLDVSRGKGEANLLTGSYTALAENLRDRSAVNRERSRAAKPSAIEFSAGTIINWLVERCELFRATRTHKGHD